MSATTEQEVQSFSIRQEIEIAAPIDTTFASVLEELGSGGKQHDGTSMHWKLEAWPGGRWFRDLGDNRGHLWGHVQVIKPPTLLEITGPMFMSFAAANHVQYRLEATSTGTRMTMTHTAIGNIPQDMRDGMNEGWNHFATNIRERAERR